MITEFLPNRKYKFIGKEVSWYIIDSTVRDLLLFQEVKCINQINVLSSETIVTVIFKEIQY